MIKKIIIGVVIFFVVVIIGGTIALKVFFPAEKLKAMAIEQIETALGREVTIDKISPSIFPFIGIEIKGIAIANSSDSLFLDDPFVTMNTFRVKVAVMPLFKKEVLIDEILFDGLSILIEKSTDNRYNYEDLAFMVHDSIESDSLIVDTTKMTGMPALPIPISLKKFTIKNSSIRVVDHQEGQTILVNTINHTIALDIDKTLEKVTTTGALQMANITIEKEGIPTAVKDFTVTFSHDISANLSAGEIEIRSVKLSLQQLALEMTGSVHTIWGEPRLDLSIVTDPIEIADIIAEIPTEIVPELEGVEARGTLALNIAITGSYKAPQYTGGVTISKGYLKQNDLPKALTDLNAQATFSATEFNLSNLSFNLGKSPFKLRLLVQDFTAPFIDGELSTTLDMTELSQTIDMGAGVATKGLLKAQVEAKGKMDISHPEQLALSGALIYKNFSVITPDITTAAVINGRTDLTSTALTSKVRVALGKNDIATTIVISKWFDLVLPPKNREPQRADVTVALTSQRLVTKEFLPTAPASPTQGDSSTSSTSDKTEIPGGVKPLFAPIVLPVNLTLSGKIGHLEYDAYTLDNVEFSLKSIEEMLHLKAQTGLYGGKANVVVDFGKKKKSGERIDLNTRIKITHVDANKLFSSYNNTLSDATKLNRYLKDLDNTIYGTLNLTADMETHGTNDREMTDNVSGVVNAKVLKGTIKSNNLTEALNEKLSKFVTFKDLKFKDLKMRAKVDKGVVTIDTLKINAPIVAEWMVRGTVATNGDLAMNIESRLNKKLSAPIIKAGARVSGAATSLINQYLGGTGLDAVAQNEVNKRGVSSDKEGRVTLLLFYGGTLDHPNPSFKGFKQFGDGASSQKQSVVHNKEVQKEVKRVKEQVLHEVDKAFGSEAKKEATKLFKSFGF